LRSTVAVIGFNASEGTDAIAPSPGVLEQVMAQDEQKPQSIWQAVLLRAAYPFTSAVPIPDRFAQLVDWIEADAERYGRLMAEADAELLRRKQKLLVMFDALDRLGQDWQGTRTLLQGLLRRALAAKSYRAIRMKLFMRPDQFADPILFEFPDASKIKNDRVTLDWPAIELYDFLFICLKRAPSSGAAFIRLLHHLHVGDQDGPHQPEEQKRVVDALAGEFMGSGDKKGRVYTWLPLHLADALGETSPRTFLTAWREAAHHGPPPLNKAVDHLGLSEGVRMASADRLNELKEDYPWIESVLEPLRGEIVPLEQHTLEALWKAQGTAKKIRQDAKDRPQLMPLQFFSKQGSDEIVLIKTLQSIGVLEIRTTGKINIPDIFRVEAGIKRKGGVKPP
jgi:hypothetical protein